MRNGIALAVLFLFSLNTFSQTNAERLEELKTQNLTRIAFGSCNNQNQKQPLWKDLMLTKPDLWIWGGDIIYADWEWHYDIKASYEKQKTHPAYQNFTQATPVIGIWDDHDFAGDNASGRNPRKIENQKLLLDFLDETEDSPRRAQEGIYTSYEFGDEDKKIKVILLDGRYFKGLEPDAPLLGSKQWQWLEDEIRNSTAKIHFIVSGLSIFSPLLPYSDEWWQWPSEVRRLQKIINDYRPQGTVFLTGDKHFASIFKSYGQLEFLSSGMTHTIDRRVWWYLGRKYPTTYFGLNYGMIDIAWEGPNPVITLNIRTPQGQSIHPRKYRWSPQGRWDRVKQVWDLEDDIQVEEFAMNDLPGPVQLWPEDIH